MKLFLRGTLLVASSLRACSITAPAQSLTIDAATITTPVSPTLYGLMTEEINHSYDGGLYAEMVSNRTFRTAWDGVQQWGLVRNGSAQARMAIEKANGPSKALPTSLKLTITAASPGNEAGLSNPGYWGMAVRPDTTYKGSLYAQIGAQPGDQDPGPITVQLIADDSGDSLAQAVVTPKPGAWARYDFTLHTGRVDNVSAHNHLQLTVAHPGTLSLQLVSLFPPTYHDRPNGNRPDLMERMAAMHPTFLRLPGGNYLEGDRPEDWYNWPTTLGPLVDRPGHQAPWTYWSTDGLGLLEFLEWCEDLHVEPVLAVYAGYALKGQRVEGKELEPFIQSALDEVEYVTGDTTTKWGAQRAKDGHPAPFPLHYIEVGNEDWLDHSGSYERRYPPFALALRKKYPQYKLIATAPLKTSTPGAEPDLIDDHFYKSPADMFDLVHHYDTAPRTGPKIFVGEWATRSGSPTPNFGDALGDAAWMTSMERNSDLILMSAYAPMLVNVNPGAMQWATDLIGFDALTTYASPSYWAQALFASHLGEGTAKSTATGLPDRVFYSATVSAQKGDQPHTLHLKLVNATQAAQPIILILSGLGSGTHTAQLQSLHAATYQATNSITDPDAIHPVSTTTKLHEGQQSYVIPAYTIQVLDIPVQ